jgi:hypothetical protein
LFWCWHCSFFVSGMLASAVRAKLHAALYSSHGFAYLWNLRAYALLEHFGFCFLCEMPVQKAATKIVPMQGSVVRGKKNPQVKSLKEARKRFCPEVVSIFCVHILLVCDAWPIDLFFVSSRSKKVATIVVPQPPSCFWASGSSQTSMESFAEIATWSGPSRPYFLFLACWYAVRCEDTFKLFER